MEATTVPLHEVLTPLEAMSLCATLNRGGIKANFQTQDGKRVVLVSPRDAAVAIVALYRWFDRRKSDTEILRETVERRLGNGS